MKEAGGQARDWRAVREEFPAARGAAYLNTAAGGPISRRAHAAVQAYYRAALRDGDTHWDEWLGRVEEVRGRTAALLGVQAREVAFVANASAAFNLVAGMVARGLAGERGAGPAAGTAAGRVLALRGDFPSVTLPWLQQGFAVDFVPPAAHGGAELDALEHARRRDTVALALGLVHYRTGYRHDLAELAAWCRARRIALAIDATQALGAVPLDFGASGADFLVASGYKWLGAGYGVALLAVRDRHLLPQRYPAAGWRSAAEPYALVSDRLALAAEARALELGHPPFAGVFALGAALELLREVGIEQVAGRIASLQALGRSRLSDIGLPPLELPQGHGSGILWFRCEGAGELVRPLAARGVLVSARGGGIRVSTHLFNTEEDVERLVRALRQLPSRVARQGER